MACAQSPVTGSSERGQDLLTPLLEALALEPKYQPSLALPLTAKQDGGEISMRMRNGSAHVLRCLKVWYDLPPDTFFNAVNIMDRFLTRMKAQPKHLSCIAVSAFHLSCQFTPGYSHLRDIPQVVPDSRDLTTISQCKCSSGDVTRMERIIMDKLATDLRCQPPVTPLTLLRVLYAAHNHLAAPLVHHPTLPPPLTTLIHKLEIVECDSAAATFRPSELALSLLALEFSQDAANKHIHHACINHLQNICKVTYDTFDQCQKVVAELMDQYENQRHSPHRQRLVWKLSNRTLRQLRPTDKFTTRLPTIVEMQGPSHPPIIRPRMDSESSEMYVSSSEEEMDYDYDEEFPPLPTPAASMKSPRKSPSQSPHKKTPAFLPYPQFNRKHNRIA
ncbi:cyclin G-like [Homarus americanus]|uniref:Cyclin-G-like n=1 Tax=Homarus americanus TaxID=6706 RepID=A0A8J5MPR5_HOMAM|nr:cyclin G-like [Homarus americanus]KAG7159263.1 cyclin-G-like [Homarus americanus]